MRAASLIKRLAAVAAWLSIASCVINPVTGDRELAIVSADQEVAIGEQQYLPSRQMQGGEYLRDPALTAYVQGIGRRLGDVSDRALPYEFVVLNNSVPNAWALPGGKIAVNRGLLVELESEAELAAVLGHEIVHAAARHGALAMQRGLLLQTAVTIAAATSRGNDHSDLAVGAAGLGASLVHMRHGRQDELESDEYGMLYMSRAGYDASAAISLQETFVRLSEGRNQGGFATLFASHPPSAERVERNRATAATLPPGGSLGREAFQSATANLRRDAPGYEALDAGRAALAEDNVAEARRQAELALERIPDEAGVEALLGDIEMAADAPGRAIEHYERALARNDAFFYYHLGKADAHLALDQLTQAAAAYEASIALLPTGGAYLGLGRIAERRGNVALALEHYATAAESSGAAGEAARSAQLRLDLPQNPGRYLSLATGLDANQRLLVEIGNPTGSEIGGIEITISYVEGGQARQVRRALEGTLAAGATRRYATGLGPFASTEAYQVSIGAARIVTAR
jgi:predicted Zn-dependent protease